MMRIPFYQSSEWSVFLFLQVRLFVLRISQFTLSLNLCHFFGLNVVASLQSIVSWSMTYQFDICKLAGRDFEKYNSIHPLTHTASVMMHRWVSVHILINPQKLIPRNITPSCLCYFMIFKVSLISSFIYQLPFNHAKLKKVCLKWLLTGFPFFLIISIDCQFCSADLDLVGLELKDY